MTLPGRVFQTSSPKRTTLDVGDGAVLLLLASLIYLGARLAASAPAVIRGPAISLDPGALPLYAALSLGRMLLAYCLSLAFSIAYAYIAARSPAAERWMMPLLDVLQSVPILSFLPVVLLSLIAVLPQRLAVELASVVLIFTSQVWNMTFSLYQALRTLPKEMREAAAVFRFSPWLRFKRVELPFSALGLIWNSVMSWAGGWFFLMAAEIFTLGERDFRLPGIGAYLQTAANQGNEEALLLGVGTLVLLIVLLDQLLWRPLLAWAERFKVSQVEDDRPAHSWFLDLLQRSTLLSRLGERWLAPLSARVDRTLNKPPEEIASLEPVSISGETPVWQRALGLVVLLGLVLGGAGAAQLLLTMPGGAWVGIAAGAGATLLRVTTAVALALAWTIPVGVLIGTNDRAAQVLQPVVQVLASIPATALFPILLLGLLQTPGRENLAAVLLMLLGTQWYLLFNVIAGAAAIPRDLKDTTSLLQLGRWPRWRTLILPALFPYIVTGLVTASGGAWNASIVAEYIHFGGQVHRLTGLGALITGATAEGDYALLLASTLGMVVLVVAINRVVWRRLYALAETQYRMDQ